MRGMASEDMDAAFFCLALMDFCRAMPKFIWNIEYVDMSWTKEMPRKTRTMMMMMVRGISALKMMGIWTIKFRPKVMPCKI